MPPLPPSFAVMNLQTVGMLIMLGAIVYLWLTVSRLARTVRSLERRTIPPEPAKNAPSPPEISATAAVDEGIIAAIAAAVAVVVRPPHRIVAIHPDADTQHAWSAEGRRQIYLSHKIR
jgi:hypothetical protein